MHHTGTVSSSALYPTYCLVICIISYVLSRHLYYILRTVCHLYYIPAWALIFLIELLALVHGLISIVPGLLALGPGLLALGLGRLALVPGLFALGRVLLSASVFAYLSKS